LNRNEATYNINYLSNKLSEQEKIKSSQQDKNSIGKQLGLYQDLQDLVSKINNSPTIFPDFMLQLKIFPRHGWNGRGIKKNEDF